MRTLFNATLVLLGLGACQLAAAVQQARRIDVYVTPYYTAAIGKDGAPRINVHSQFDPLLASNERRVIEEVRGYIVANPGNVSPMTLMVLAIRLYDVGLRDEGTFWFYVAKSRYLTAASVLDFNTAMLAGSREGMGAFATLAGPYFNSYAFCNPANQQVLRRKALDWVTAHPYGVIHLATLPKLPGDAEENLKKNIAKQEANLKLEAEYLANADNQQQMRELRASRQVDEQFCWRDE